MIIDTMCMFNRKGVCNFHGLEFYQKTVTPDICNSCYLIQEVGNFAAEINPEINTPVTSQPRIMPNGEIHYVQKGKEPPMDVRGYKRKAPKGPDAWKFVPDFPPCKERTIRLWYRGCGTVGVHIVCNQTKAGCKHENWNPCPRLNPPKT